MNSNYPNHIFLFILDAVRKDHLSLYGYKRKTTPNINKLAKQADVYQWAFSPSSYTHAAIPSVLTGKYPFNINNPFFSWQLNNDDLTLLKQIKKMGYKLALFTAHISSSSKNSNLHKIFDYVYEDLSKSETNRKEMLVGESKNIVSNLNKYLLKNKNKKIFALIHLMEAHGPYDHNYDSIFINDSIFKKDRRKIERVVFDDLREVSDETLKNKIIPRYQLYKPIFDSDGNIEDFNPEARYYVAHYDMGIYTQDKNIGVFINNLKKNKLFDKSAIIITSDHGELMGEDNIYFSHGIYTHPSLINIPLIIKWPNQKKQKLINENFSNQYLIHKIFEDKKLKKEDYLNLNGICLSFTPKSFSIIKDNYLIMIHNGKYNFDGEKYENFFKLWKLNDEENIDNFLNFKTNLHFKLYVKKKSNFVEIKNKNNELVKSLLEVNFKINKNNFILLFKQLENKHKKNLESLTNQLNQLNETNKKQAQQIDYLNNENYQLKLTLNKIYTSKTWKLLYWYKKIISIFKKK